MADFTRETIIEWANAAKLHADCADIEPAPRDESFMRGNKVLTRSKPIVAEEKADV